jgi:hypothetical protein
MQNLEQLADFLRRAGENFAIAAGGVNGIADGIASGALSGSYLADLRANGQKVIDAAPIAISQVKDWCNAVDRLQKIIWASVGSGGKSPDSTEK